MKNKRPEKQLNDLGRRYNRLQRRLIAADPGNPSCDLQRATTAADMVVDAMYEIFALAEYELAAANQVMDRNKDDLVRTIDKRGYYTREDVQQLRQTAPVRRALTLA